MREFIQTAKIHEIFSQIFTVFDINPRLVPESPSDFSGNTPEPLVKREHPSQDPNSPQCTQIVPVGTLYEVETFNDSLRKLKYLRTPKWIGYPSVNFTSNACFSDRYPKVI